MRNIERHLKFATLIAILALTITGCTARNGGTKSNISISFPEAEVKSAAAAGGGTQARSFDFSRACFAVNVTANDIKASSRNSCSIPVGVFGGFVAPGGTLTVSIPRGSARTLEVFAYLRPNATTPCPVQPDFGTIAPNKVTRVGAVANFDAQTDEVTLTVNLNSPAANDTLISQYSLASTCAETAAPPSAAGFTNGHVHATGAGYVVDASVAGSRNTGTLTGGQYKIKLTRKPTN